MLNKLEAIKARFDQVGIALTNPEIINNQKEFGIYSKEYRSLEKIIQPYEAYIRVLADHKFAKDGLNSPDEDMRELAKMELPELEIQKEEITAKTMDILDSIHYAKRIQSTILPTHTRLNELFKQHFVFY